MVSDAKENSAQLFPIGAMVEFVHPKPQFNGLRGEVIANNLRENKGKYQVKFADDFSQRPFNVLPRFLRALKEGCTEKDQTQPVLADSKRSPNTPKTVSSRKGDSRPRQARQENPPAVRRIQLTESAANGDELPESDDEDEREYLAALREDSGELEDDSEESDTADSPLHTQNSFRAANTELKKTPPRKALTRPPYPRSYILWKQRNSNSRPVLRPSISQMQAQNEKAEVFAKQGNEVAVESRVLKSVDSTEGWEIHQGAARRLLKTISLAHIEESKAVNANPFLQNDRKANGPLKRRRPRRKRAQ